MAKLGPYELNSIVTGDARELAKRIPDGSVDLIFTDPVYQNIEDYRWLAKMAIRVLNPNGQVLVYFAMYHLQKTINAMSPPLSLKWLNAEKKIGTSTRIWSYRLFSHWKPYLWLTGPEWQTNGRWYKDFVFSRPDGKNVNYQWSKNMPALVEIMASHTLNSDVVFDPFCGGGSMLAAAKMLGRSYLGFEIDSDITALARQRIAQTQPPLFVLDPQQLELLPQK